MDYCPEHLDDIWLDVHGEMEPAKQEAWQAHLRVCPGCREERERTARLLEAAGEVLRAGSARPGEEAALRRRILDRLNRERGRAGGPGGRFLPRPALAWPLAALGLAALVSGWLWLGPDKGADPRQTATALETETGADQDDKEILRNFGLLEELEVVEKVVRVVDRRDVRL